MSLGNFLGSVGGAIGELELIKEFGYDDFKMRL